MRMLDNPTIFYSSHGQVCPCTLTAQVGGLMKPALMPLREVVLLSLISLRSAVLTSLCAGVSVLVVNCAYSSVA